MGMRNQQVRGSQYIFTYGPGSILETTTGPVIVPTLNRLFESISKDPVTFEIAEARLSAALGGCRLVRLPSNDDLMLPADQEVHPTGAFPNWSLCTRHPDKQLLYPSWKGCPLCTGPNWAKKQRAGEEAIRFVSACKCGHLDDVNWNLIVHGNSSPCQPSHYEWIGGGRALKYVTIRCPKCHVKQNFGKAYGREWPCSGRLAESMTDDRPGCDQSARIMQRGSTSLRLPVTVSALTLTSGPRPVFDILTRVEVRSALDGFMIGRTLDEPTIQLFIQETKVLSAFQRKVLVHALNDDWNGLAAIIGSLDIKEEAGGEDSIRAEEFQVLVRSATEGAPPVPGATDLAPPVFELPKEGVRLIPGPSGRLTLRVSPINRLRVVIAQTGYRRFDDSADEVSVAFKRADIDWVPAVELHGEGIFIDTDSTPLGLKGTRAALWASRGVAAEEIWWHTLSHRLLRALSVDSGYGSASIRERVLVPPASPGGLLLYASQPGSDGTLGGLIDLVTRFESVLESAFTDLDSCSNDPLCAQVVEDGAEGAACYSCLFSSETSCELLNFSLDRLLLLENLP